MSVLKVDLDVCGKVVEVDCFVCDGELSDLINGEMDYSDLLKLPHVYDNINRQIEDYKANLKAGV